MISDDEKRWLVVGLVLNKVLRLPEIRRKVEQDVKAEYLSLVKSHGIDTQASAGRLTKWKVDFLKYENINGNAGHKLPRGKPYYKKFNYHVTSHHDFAKLYLQPFMAKFSKVDECDASAVLTLLGAVPVFSGATQAAAVNVRQNIRNEWAHCDFAKWKEPMFKNCFHKMDLLVQSLGLPNYPQIVAELKEWETKGLNRIDPFPVDQALLTMAQQDIASLKAEVQLLNPNDYAKKEAQLTNLSDRLTEVEKKVDQNQKKIAENTKEIVANARDIASNEVKLEAINAVLAAHADTIEEHASAIDAAKRNGEAQERTILSESEETQMKVNNVRANTVIPETSLPSMAPHFTGHQKGIDDLTARMCSSPTRLFSIWGSGGFGKTSLAVAVGHRLKKQGIRTWFVSLRGVDTVEALLDKLLTFLRQTPHSTVKPKSQALDSLCSYFRTINKDTVLILDNADLLLLSGDTKSSFLRSLQEVLQASTNLRIICTSRETMSYVGLTFDVYPFRIGTLEAAESVSLLHVLTGDLICKEQNSLRDLAKVCGYAPLGLKLMATMMSQDRVLPSEIISDLATSNILEVIDNEDCPDELRMQKIFEFSFLKLSTNYRKMFVSLTIFPGSFDEEAAAAVLSIRKISEVKKILGVLERKSFLEREQDSYFVHTLLQAFGELVEGKSSEMNECQKKSRICHHLYFLQLLEDLNTMFLTGKSSEALLRFNKYKDSFMFCLLDAASHDQTYDIATEKLTNMDIFLDTILWVDTTLSNKLYDTYMQNCEEKNGQTSILYASILLSKAFGVLYRSNDFVDQLLYEAEDIIKKLPTVPSPVKAKLFCYFGFRKLILSQIDDGVAFLEKGVPFVGIATENVVIRLIALRLLIDNYTKNSSHLITKTLQQAHSLCQGYECLKPIVLAQHAEEGNKDNKGNVPFLAQIFYFVSQICKVMKSTAHVKESLLLAIKNTDEQRATVGDTLEMAQQYHIFGDSLISIGCTSEALEVHKKALDIRLKQPRENNEDTASSYYKIGKTLYKLGEYDHALHFYSRALDVRQKVLGEVNKDTASSYSVIGTTQVELGKYLSALDSHRRALDIRLEVLGKNHEDTAWSYCNIGWTYSKMGNYSSALDPHKHALDIRLKLHGEDNKSIAWSYNNLGETQSKLGDHTNALLSHKHALDIRLKIYGEDNKDTAWSYNNLGETQSNLGDHTNALSSHKHALAIRLKVFGNEHEDTAWSYHNIGATYSKLGDYEKAQDPHRNALHIRRNVLGKDHEYTAWSFYNLGEIYSKLKVYTNALLFHREALSIRLKLLGYDNEDTAWSYNNIGHIQYKLRDYGDALTSHQQARTIRLNQHGHDNVDTAWSCNNIGETYLKLRDYHRALTSHEEALAIRLKLFGEDHADTARSYSNLGLTHFKLKNYERALNFLKHALAIYRKVHRENNKDIAWSYHNIGLTHYELEDYHSAVTSHEQARDIRQKLFGEEHVITAWSYNSLGETHFKLREYENALKFHRQALAIYLSVHGEDNKDTAWSYHNIGLTHYELGDYHSALTSHEQARDIRQKLFGMGNKDTEFSNKQIRKARDKLGGIH